MVRGVVLLLACGGLAMADGQDKRDGGDEFPDRVTFRRTAPGEPPGKGEWPDVPAKRREVDGKTYWDVLGGKLGTVPRGPKKGDTVVEKDGTAWEVMKVEGSYILTCVKAKSPPKKPR